MTDNLQNALDSIHFDHDLTYYISGPMSGYPEFNYPAFNQAEIDLAEQDVRTVNPTNCFVGEPLGSRDYTEYLRAAFRMLLMAEGIIMLRGWPESKGARAELDIAMDLKMPVYYWDSGVMISMNQENP
jgi:hypothetical protein